MKTRINLTIEESLLNKVKRYAANKQMSVSDIIVADTLVMMDFSY